MELIFFTLMLCNISGGSCSHTGNGPSQYSSIEHCRRDADAFNGMYVNGKDNLRARCFDKNWRLVEGGKTDAELRKPTMLEAAAALDPNKLVPVFLKEGCPKLGVSECNKLQAVVQRGGLTDEESACIKQWLGSLPEKVGDAFAAAKQGPDTIVLFAVMGQRCVKT